MQKSSLYPTIYVLGNGQLGRMLRYAGAPLDIHVVPLAFAQSPFRLDENAVITAEIERWPTTELTNLLASHPNFINRKIFARLADRLTQKQLLDQLNLATSPWVHLTKDTVWQHVWQNVAEKVVVKRRTGGYDGRGQWIVDQHNTDVITDDLFNETIAEAFIPFDSEVSLVGARFADGSTYFYPITQNLQQQGILRYSVIANTDRHQLQTKAEQMLGKIMQHLDYIGVMAMECFVVDGQLLINELAPRVHNSGHWTQYGANISQFELHLRALLNLPTPPLQARMPSVMVNLIGTAHQADWLALPYSQLHWYGKEVRSGRKLGHINIAHQHPDVLIDTLTQLAPLLPEDYQSGLAWAKQCLTK
ncbi:5-(carboxyamino)imidazole ribonucleotide synthase [Gallibacterium trehalosifermentans]|uniref:N5-carboxyaminoimidazole ribonucleotide synthase n=1 Tax=Gallibacterium trehalosifermentans TaxID=516935 RepID=A0ABV6GYB6_9PAST